MNFCHSLQKRKVSLKLYKAQDMVSPQILKKPKTHTTQAPLAYPSVKIYGTSLYC